MSPDWLTALARSLAPRDDSGIPVANAKLEDVSDLLGGALFLPLFKWMLEYGPVYRLAAGPRNFVVVSDPAIAKHVLRSYGTNHIWFSAISSRHFAVLPVPALKLKGAGPLRLAK